MTKTVCYTQCAGYEYENVKKSIEKIFNSFPDLIEKLNTSEKLKVLVKPNLLAPRHPDKAVTTHPAVLKAVVEFLQKYNCQITIGDTPAGTYNEKVLERLYSTCQIDKVAKETGATLNFDLSDTMVDFPHGKAMKKCLVITPAIEADLIINIAKLKTHTFTRLTCATKNLFGLIPGVVKFRHHLAMPDLKIFGQMLNDINKYFEDKVFHIVDGVVGMEGMGPSGGDPKHAGALFGGWNPEAVDVIACQIMQMPTDSVPTIITLKNTNDVDLINSDEIKTFSFKLPPIRLKSIPEKIPQWAQDFLTEIIIAKPIIKKELCKKCNICIESCPAEIITLKENGAVIKEYNKCIRCYCCQEGCPFNAIELSQPLAERCYKFVRKFNRTKR